MDLDPLTNDDVADILALLDSLPYDEFDLETPRFRLSLRRTPDGWTQSTQVLSAPEPTAPSDGTSVAVLAGPTAHRRNRTRAWGGTVTLRASERRVGLGLAPGTEAGTGTGARRRMGLVR